MDRRTWLAWLGSTTALSTLASVESASGETPITSAPSQPRDRQTIMKSFRYCLNTSTIRQQKLSLPEEIDLASQVGYQAIEPWIRELDTYQQSGGKLSDLKKRLDDKNVTVEGAIDFFQWASDDASIRQKGLEDAKSTMDRLAQLGAKRVAAPPAGIHKAKPVSLEALADRYRALLEVGEKTGVQPQLEIWGPSTNLSRLSEAMYVASGADHPQACLLMDVYHLHRGGSGFEGLGLLNGRVLPVMHVNDYPGTPAAAQLNDGDRVYPGDGVAPFNRIIEILIDIEFDGFLSLELFNRDYWKQDAQTVAKTGLEKTKAVVERAVQAKLASSR